MTMTPRPQANEARRIVESRSTWLLLATWEMAECQRDDFATAGCALGVQAAAEYLGFIIDELDRRYPYVMYRWHAHDDMGELLDLHGMFADAYREEVER